MEPHETPPREREGEGEGEEERVANGRITGPSCPEACEAIEGGSNEPSGKVIRRVQSLGGVEVASERVLGG